MLSDESVALFPPPGVNQSLPPVECQEGGRVRAPSHTARPNAEKCQIPPGEGVEGSGGRRKWSRWEERFRPPAVYKPPHIINSTSALRDQSVDFFHLTYYCR